MPGISGLELLERAQAKNPGLKLILITGVIDPQVRKQVSQAGAEAFFFKPLEMPDFLGAVERCLGLGHSTRAASASQPAAVSAKPEPPAAGPQPFHAALQPERSIEGGLRIAIR